MVHFVGGPSVGGYKSYINHTTAREGQWRMPRVYARPKVDIKIKNYNYCNHGAVNTGFQMPAWLQWAQGIMGLLQGFIPAPKEAAQPEANPLQAKVDELEAKIKELEKGKETNEPVVNEPQVEVKDNFKVEDNVKEEEITNTTPDKEEETTVKVNNKTVKVDANHNRGYNWDSLRDAYGIPKNKHKAFVAAFRSQELNGATSIGLGEQHYPKTFTFEGKTYTFNEGNYKPNVYPVNPNYRGTEAHTTAKTKTIKGTITKTKVYTGTATATWTDKDGKTTTRSSQTTQKYKTEAEAREAARSDLQGKVPEKHRSNAFFQTGAKK